MKVHSSIALALALVTMIAVRADADDAVPSKAAPNPDKVVYDANSAFAFLKTLAGNWERQGGDHDHGGASHDVIFKNTAAGSSVMETMFPGEAD